VPTNQVDELLGSVKGAFSKKAEAARRAVAARNAAKPARPSKVVLITDSKAHKAISIGAGGLLRVCGMSELARGIREVDVEGMGGRDNAESVHFVCSIITPAMLEVVREYDGDEALLDKAEEFIRHCLVPTPQALQRVQVAVGVADLEDSLALVTERCQLIQEACREIKESVRLRSLLRDVIVPLGNRLNAGSKVGEAAGVRIDTLTTLVRTKASSGQSFLRFIVEGLMTSDEGVELLHVVDDCPKVVFTKPNYFNWAPIMTELVSIKRTEADAAALASSAL
jgi:hypothetical protein